MAKNKPINPNTITIGIHHPKLTYVDLVPILAFLILRLRDCTADSAVSKYSSRLPAPLGTPLGLGTDWADGTAGGEAGEKP